MKGKRPNIYTLCVFVMLAGSLALPDPALGQYDFDADDEAWEVEDESDEWPVWARGLLDVRLARGGRSSSWGDRGAAKTRYGGRRGQGGLRRVTRAVVSQLALEVGADLPWDISARAQLNWTPDIDGMDDAPQLIEAFLRKEWGEWEQGWGLRAGVMNIPFSLEHRGPAITPKYTLTPSALNTWLWEEAKVVGFEADWWRETHSGWRLTVLAGTGFGADQAGHLLAVRGWTLHDALSGVNSQLPLPGSGRGNVEVFDERDHRPAVYTWLTLQDPDKWGLLGIGYFDNLGDQGKRGVWETRYGTVGAVLHPLSQVDFLVQYMAGSASHSCGCDVGFTAFYALLSAHHRGHRLSARFDVFRTNDQDGPPNYRDHGDAFTVAYLFEFGLHHRLAFEYMWVQSRHAGPFRGSPSDDGWQLSYRFRY